MKPIGSHALSDHVYEQAAANLSEMMMPSEQIATQVKPMTKQSAIDFHKLNSGGFSARRQMILGFLTNKAGLFITS